MNGSDLAKKVAATTGITQAKAKEVIQALFDPEIGIIVQTTSGKKGEKVLIQGFGTFETRLRAARNGVNPATGEKIKIAAKRQFKFTPSKKLNEALN